ncbi:MAG: chemotaxis protein CheD [Gemmatimonadaceae bacterium]
MSAAPLPPAVEHRVRVAQFVVATHGVISTIGLGSCVAIAMHDPSAGIGALAHVLLPDPSMSTDVTNPAKFAQTAVPAMVEALRGRGAIPGRLQAKLAGGASMFANLLATSGINVGERNVLAARDALRAAGIPLIAEDTGGDQGRSVLFRIADGALEVRTLRRGTHVL